MYMETFAVPIVVDVVIIIIYIVICLLTHVLLPLTWLDCVLLGDRGSASLLHSQVLEQCVNHKSTIRVYTYILKLAVR